MADTDEATTTGGFGLNPEGWRGKRLADIRESLEADLIQIRDPDTGETLQPDFNEADPFIQAINTLLDNNAKTWELGQLIVNSFDPALATGAALSGLVQLNGIMRLAGRPTTLTLALTGTANTLIRAGIQVSDSQQTTIFTTDQAVTLDADGEGSVTASSMANGSFVTLSGTITTILTPAAGLQSVTNPDDATLGAADESDVMLRARRDRSTETPSIGPVEAIHGALLNLPGVTYARVYLNNTLETDTRGIPGKALAAVVLGGEDEDIARTLFLRNPIASYHGDASLNLTDRQGQSYGIRWIRPTTRRIFVRVDVRVIDGEIFPDDAQTQIQQAIIIYAQQGRAGLNIPPVAGFEETGFNPGVDVTLTRLYTPINSVPGHEVDVLEIGTSRNNLSTSNIDIAFDELALFSSADITVNIVT